MASPTRLQGTELMTVPTPSRELKLPPASVAMKISTPLPRTEASLENMNTIKLSELITDQEMLPQLGGGEVLLDTPSEL